VGARQALSRLANATASPLIHVAGQPLFHGGISAEDQCSLVSGRNLELTRVIVEDLRAYQRAPACHIVARHGSVDL